MFSFSQKIFISYCFVFFIFLALMVPFSNQIVHYIANRSMEERASNLITKVQLAPNNEAMIKLLKQLKATVFFRMSVITNERKVLYDSSVKRIVGKKFSQDYVVNHKEVLEAFKKGVGYNEDYSNLLGQKFTYVAKAFDFHGKTYVMRVAFPFDYISELTEDLKSGFIIVGTLVLLLFSLMTWFLIHSLTKPIQQIIHAIKPYQDGLSVRIPEIKLKGVSSTDEFQKLADTLNTHYKLLEMRKDFVDNASHELKTPLTIIRGFAEALHDHPDLSQEMREEITSKMVRNCNRMNELILDLLTLSDIENIPESRRDVIDLYELINKCAAHVKEAYPDAKIEIEMDELQFVGDPYLLELAFNNLIENAAKYSEGNAEIKIQMETVKNWIKVTISDKGVGIAKEDLPHLFERFFTVNKAHSRKLGGSGLGLSIVETIIHKHFGKISVQSTLRQGSTFTILLPKNQGFSA